MGSSFLITLREGLEAALIIAILIAYLVKTNRRDQTRQVWVGAIAATILCLIAGVIINAAVGGLNGKVEYAVEGLIALTACSVLTWMIFWMRQHSRGLSGELRSKVDASSGTLALVVIAFVAVLREGLETALFLISAENGSASGTAVVFGGVLGLAVSAVLGWLFYKGGHRVNLATFFKYTGILLILFAAGLAGKVIHEAHDLFGLNGWFFDSAWNVQSGPLASGTLHDFLKGLFGWHPQAENLRVITYVVYATVVTRLFLKTQSAPAVTESATPVGAVK